jgi:hypothetical protein
MSDGQEVVRGSNPAVASSLPSPTAIGKLVDLNSSALAAGTLAAWPNSGGLGGSFKADNAPLVESVAGVKGVTFDGSSVMDGPVVPLFVTGDAPRTIDAWIFNPEAAGEETIFSFGRRGGPDGSNVSFNHGSNGTFGAVGQWGAYDIGWTGKVVTGQWTHVAYTYDPSTSAAVVYSNGDPATTRVMPGPLSTHSNDNLPDGGRPWVGPRWVPADRSASPVSASMTRRSLPKPSRLSTPRKLQATRRPPCRPRSRASSTTALRIV